MSAEVDVYTPRERTSLPAKIQYAKMLAESGLLPTAYRKQPANVLYAIEYGDMLGLSPMAAITGIHIIEGKPSASAGLISGLVRQAGHQLRVQGDGKSATCQITRSDDPDHTFKVTWTLKRNDDGNPSAEEAALLGKDVWKKYPASMLKSRAITQCARDACEEVLYGLHYTPEELGAEVDGEGNVVGEIVPGDAPAEQAAASPDPAGDLWVAHPDPDQEEWGATVAQLSTFATDDDGRALWKAVYERQQAKKISKAEGKRLQELIKARWAELKTEAEADAEVAEEPVDGVIVDDLDPSDAWALKVQEVTDDDGAAELTEEVVRELAAGHIDDGKAAAVHAAIAARVDTLDGQGTLA